MGKRERKKNPGTSAAVMGHRRDVIQVEHPAPHRQHLPHSTAEVSVAFSSLEQAKSMVQDKVTATQCVCASTMALQAPALHPAQVPAALCCCSRLISEGLIVLKQMTLFI